MLRILLNPYLLVIATSLITAGLVTLYNKTMETDKNKINNAFFKILIFGAISGLAFVFVVDRPDAILAEPFFEDAASSGGSF